MTEGSIIEQLESQAPEQHRLTIRDYLPGGSTTLEAAAGFEGFQKLEDNYHDYNRQLAAIKNNPDLSDDERMSLAAEARTEAVAAQEQAAENLAGAVAKERRTLERRLFAGPNQGPDTLVDRQANIAAQQAYRGALESVSWQDSEGLIDTLERANLVGDETLARAVLVTAHREGYTDVVSRYADGRPEEARRYSQLSSLPGPEALQKLADAFRPPEVAGVEQLRTPEHVRQQQERERRNREQAALRERHLGSSVRSRGRFDRTPPR